MAGSDEDGPDLIGIDASRLKAVLDAALSDFRELEERLTTQVSALEARLAMLERKLNPER